MHTRFGKQDPWSTAVLVQPDAPHKTVGMVVSYKAGRSLWKALGLDQKDLPKPRAPTRATSPASSGRHEACDGVNAERRLALLAKALRTTVEDIYERVVPDGPEYHPDPPEAPPTLDACGPMEAAPCG